MCKWTNSLLCLRASDSFRPDIATNSRYAIYLIVVTGCIFIFSCLAYCETYTWADDDGSLHFSDNPPQATSNSNKRINFKKSIIDAVSKWTRQKEGFRLYEDEMISVVITKDIIGQIIFSVMYDLPHEMNRDRLSGSLRIGITPWDTNLPKGVNSYLSGSILGLTELSGGIEMQASPTNDTPSGISSRSIAISISVDDKATEKRKYILWKVVPYSKKWT